MYHKNKSLCFLVAEVAEVAERGRKRAFLTPSEGQVGRDGLAVVEGALAQYSSFLIFSYTSQRVTSLWASVLRQLGYTGMRVLFIDFVCRFCHQWSCKYRENNFSGNRKHSKCHA